MNDTDPAVLALQADIHRRMTGVQRLELAVELSEIARGLAMARLRAEHPEWTERRIRIELLRIALLPEPLPPGVA